MADHPIGVAVLRIIVAALVGYVVGFWRGYGRGEATTLRPTRGGGERDHG